MQTPPASLVQGRMYVAAVMLLHQGCTVWPWPGGAAALSSARKTPLCPAPVAVETAQGLRLGCADDAALETCGAQAFDRLSLKDDGTCQANKGGMPMAWYATLGLRLDINRAEADDLQALPGIGARTAQAIVRHRQAHGPFAEVESIGAVPGVGPATVGALRRHVTVGEGG